jgi:hypothetical protein
MADGWCLPLRQESYETLLDGISTMYKYGMGLEILAPGNSSSLGLNPL